jgi:hypothetical protein
MARNLVGQKSLFQKLSTLSAFLFFALFLTMQTGCTSSDNKEEGVDSASSEGDGLDSPELADDGSSNPESSGEASAEASAGGEDDIVADLGDDPTNEQAAELPEQPLGEEQATAAAPTEEAAPPAEAPPAEPAMEMASNDVPPPSSDETQEAVPEEPPAPKASLKKIKDAPFTSNGRILNTVYVARKGDTLKSVSQKLFGTNKSKELKADNTFLSRGVKPGDKIYYNSPRRPDDSSTMMTYFEDKGIPAQSYTAQEGDNLRTVSNNLLGFSEAWKELWVTNPLLDSKGDLVAGTELRYWPKGADAEMAAPPAELPPMAQAPQEMPPPALEVPPPPPMETAQLPPPPPEMPAAGTMDLPPPPPPPMASTNKKKEGSSPFMIEDEQTTMAIGIGIITFLTAILLTSLILKKGRARKMKLGQTQV